MGRKEFRPNGDKLSKLYLKPSLRRAVLTLASRLSVWNQNQQVVLLLLWMETLMDFYIYNFVRRARKNEAIIQLMLFKLLYQSKTWKNDIFQPHIFPSPNKQVTLINRFTAAGDKKKLSVWRQTQMTPLTTRTWAKKYQTFSQWLSPTRNVP